MPITPQCPLDLSTLTRTFTVLDNNGGPHLVGQCDKHGLVEDDLSKHTLAPVPDADTTVVK